MIICLGPVCVPLHLLLPFLVTLAHQRGYLTWFKREWVTMAWWLSFFNKKGSTGEAATAAAGAGQPTKCGCSTAAEGEVAGKAPEHGTPVDGSGTAAGSTSAAGLTSRRSKAAPSG